MRPAAVPSSTPTSSMVTVATPTRLATSTSSTIAGTAMRPLGAHEAHTPARPTVSGPVVPWSVTAP